MTPIEIRQAQSNSNGGSERSAQEESALKRLIATLATRMEQHASALNGLADALSELTGAPGSSGGFQQTVRMLREGNTKCNEIALRLSTMCLGVLPPSRGVQMLLDIIERLASESLQATSEIRSGLSDRGPAEKCKGELALDRLATTSQAVLAALGQDS